MDQAVFREQLRDLKRRIREDPQVRARFDTDGDGEISGPEWERAVEMLEAHLKRQAAETPAGPQAPSGASVGGGAAAATVAALRSGAAPPRQPPPSPPSAPSLAAAAPSSSAPLSLASSSQVLVKQQVEMHEVALGYETHNRYDFVDAATGTDLGGADEERGGLGSFFMRQFLGPGRPLKLSLTDSENGTWLEGTRPFKLLAFLDPPALTMTGPQGPVGLVKRQWPLFVARRYRIEVFGGRTFRIEGRLFKPWTYPVQLGGRDVALVKKKWSGLLREGFSDADTFAVSFSDSPLHPSERMLILAAALLIDFDFFEEDPND